MKKTFLFGDGILLQYIVIAENYEMAADILLTSIKTPAFDKLIRMGTLEEMATKTKHGSFYAVDPAIYSVTHS